MLQELGGWRFAAKGRYCLYHILKSLNIKGPVLVPIYCCESILQPLRELGLPWHCYDINIEDLNPNVNSIDYFIDKYNAECVIAVSMYGNPAELDKLEEICQKKGVKLIDDAAQSFGASLNGKCVGYFGDAGFFSFSPGKPLAGHLGGAFRTSNLSYRIEYTKHTLAHRFIYKDFEYNRCQNHMMNNFKGKLYGYGCFVAKKLFSLRDDIYSRFEEGALYGVYKDSLNIHIPYRTSYAHNLSHAIHSEFFRVLKPYNDDYRIGVAHKYILICKSKDIANRLNCNLRNNEIMSQMGYKMLCNCERYEQAKIIADCVVEIPLNSDKNEFDYIVQVLSDFKYNK